MADLLRTAETPVASTVHEPVGDPAGPGLWHHQGMQLPAYIQHVANRLRARGHGESNAVQMAVGIIKDWAAGHDGHGNAVHPDVQAAAVKAVAEWEALKASTGGGKRFNPYHLPVGPGGGEFTGPGGGGGGGKATAKKPPAKAVASAPKQAAGKQAHTSASKHQLLQRAAADRARAKALEAQLHTLEAQLHQHKQAAAQAKHHKAAAAKAGHISSKPKRKPSTHHHTVTHTRSLQLRIRLLRTQIRRLLAHARLLEAQAKAMK